jgi:hypothetical protein
MNAMPETKSLSITQTIPLPAPNRAAVVLSLGLLFHFTWPVLAAGHRFACADYTQGKVLILAADGRVEWEHPAPSRDELWALPNDSPLFTTGHGVKGVARENKAVFSYESKSEIYACQRLPNGNTVVSNWQGHGQFGSGPHVIEVTPDKNVVWPFADHRTMKTISSLQILDVPGDATKGEVRH